MAGLSESIEGFAAGTRRLIACGMALGLASSAASSPPMPFSAAPLCTAGESALFSCPIGTKIVSVCGGASGATYRFGRPGRVELIARNLTFANHGFSGGGETQITASTADGHSYTVYTKTVRTSFDAGGRNEPADSAGLIVRQGKRTLLSARCGTDATVSAKASTLIPPGAYLAH